MKDIWKHIFGTAWDELNIFSPDIGGFLINEADKTVMIDANAARMLGLSSEPGYDRIQAVMKAFSDQSMEESPLSFRTFSAGQDLTAVIIRINRITQNDPKLCGRGHMIGALASASERALLAMIEIQSFEGIPPAFTILNVINSISEIEPSALISRCGKRKYWIFIPDASDNGLERLQEIQKEALESLDNITFTAGISSSDKDPTVRMDTAEFMLYQANAAGKGTILNFSHELYDNRTVDLDLARNFTRLVDENLFVYNFQPIVSAHDGSIFAYEALMRTESSIGLSAEQVILYASQSNRLYDVERCTMLNALRTIANHREEFSDRKLFVNSISAYILTPEDWQNLERQYGDVMDHLVIELTEQTQVADEKLASIKERMHKSGIYLAIDDYGTGYSNTSNLLRYSPDFVKIDRALIDDINKKPKIQQLVSSIIEFIHSNGYIALAEGVETYDELKVMIKLGADLIQGFYTAHPKTYIQSTISENVVNEIIRINTELIGEISRYYHPAEGEVIDLYSLAAGHYSAIFIDNSDIVIKGTDTGAAVNIPIVIKDGIVTKITFHNICLTTEKETPLVDIGSGSTVEIELIGHNRMIKRGIHVPVDSSLKITGTGALEIQAASTSSYGIGCDKDSSYGEIVIASSGRLTISSLGDTSVGIGGGKNDSGSEIRIVSGDVRITCEGSASVGVGTLYGNAITTISDCSMSILANASDSVGIGSINGEAVISMMNFRIFVDLSGLNLCGIGIIRSGKGSIFICDGSLFGDFHGRCIRSIGTDKGDVDITIRNADVKMECGGNTITGIGDAEGSGNIEIQKSKIDLTLLAKDHEGIISKTGTVNVISTISNIKTG